jgi:hypothetical protein
VKLDYKWKLQFTTKFKAVAPGSVRQAFKYVCEYLNPEKHASSCQMFNASWSQKSFKFRYFNTLNSLLLLWQTLTILVINENLICGSPQSNLQCLIQGYLFLALLRFQTPRLFSTNPLSKSTQIISSPPLQGIIKNCLLSTPSRLVKCPANHSNSPRVPRRNKGLERLKCLFIKIFRGTMMKST